MKDEIKVNEYIRTKDGIIGRIYEEDDIEEKGVYIDTIYLDDYHDETSFVNYKDIKKHSSNINELVEEGDFVNEEKVIEIREQNGKIYLMTDYVIQRYIKGNIKSIVTHEQFNWAEYVV